jgi:hypothetical protein
MTALWRRLLCRVGLHRWVWIDVYETECGVYINDTQVCLWCDKTRRPR